MIKEQNMKKITEELTGVELTENEKKLIEWLADYPPRTTDALIHIFEKLKKRS